MKITITNDEGNYIEKNVQLGMYNIIDCFYEEGFTESGKDSSYFLIYFETPPNKSDAPTWFDAKIPFDYKKMNGTNEPTYVEELKSYKFYYHAVETICELAEDEKMILINVCIKALLESAGIDIDYKEEDIS